MPNMRVISRNVADTAAITVTEGSTASGFSADSMKTDYKSTFHRTGATVTTTTYTLTWTTDQSINAVALPCTNLTAAATIQVVLRNSGGGTVVDSGAISACANSPIAQLTASTPTGNLFQLGVLSKTSVWFASQYNNVRSLTIRLVDTGNPATFIDCARIVCGQYWQPTYNAGRTGLDITVADSSTNSRTDGGDLVSDRGFVYDELSLNLALLADTDRDNLLQLTRTVGTNRNILVSVFPTDYNASTTRNSLTEQQYTVYGKRANSAFNYIIQGFGSSTLQLTGW
jgi:hypothetical protein